MPNQNRKAKMESLLKREIASFMLSELRDPRLGFITITRVELTGDLQDVTCYYTILGSDKDRKLAQLALKSARGRVASAYAQVLRTRILPRLRFAYDDVEDRRNSMEDLIARARSTDPDHSLAVEPAPGAEDDDRP